MPPSVTPALPANVRAVIFDCDGVLVDSWNSTKHYFNSIRSAVGLGPMDEEQEHYCFVHTVPISVAYIVPKADLEKALHAARTFPFEELESLVRLQPGVDGFLERLQQAGLVLGVVTNAGNEQHAILKHLGIHHRFDRIVTTEDVDHGKPSPEGIQLILNQFGLEPEQALFIGDSQLDRAAAQAAEVLFWGFGPLAPSDTVNLDRYDML